jgi:hypothetical protein
MVSIGLFTWSPLYIGAALFLHGSEIAEAERISCACDITTSLYLNRPLSKDDEEVYRLPCFFHPHQTLTLPRSDKNARPIF